MKYVLLFCGTEEDARAYQALSETELRARYERVAAWFGDPRVTGGLRVAPGSESVTVRFGANGDALVTDGPFIEGNEDIGGWAIVEVGNRDEAVAMARTWPGRGVVEVRPAMPDGG